MNAVIFDMDGVLVDSERVVWESFRYAGEKTGVPDVERMAIIGLGLNDEAWIKRFRQEFGADSDRILEHEEAYLQNFYANGAAPAKKGAQRLLDTSWSISKTDSHLRQKAGNMELDFLNVIRLLRLYYDGIKKGGNYYA